MPADQQWSLPRSGPVPYDIDQIERRIAIHQRPVPQSDQEWQYVADLAELCQSLDAARMFGLVEGGPTINEVKCDWFLDAAARRGITPAPSEALMHRFIASMAET